ncbi:CvpA family protein [Swingsia samuiensis]|uniref:CvpA family protein n=1 Tax=Swingsia samuiensis TaxID=1293412 RepID=A0A4Y6UIA9_9PROT|nr:CvpA family protein [Swingsia samuiensis]QDH17252.1 CvpA family protein [Swingsia samuiensis]
MPDLSRFVPQNLTHFDMIVLVVLGLSALWGLTRGFATELSGLVAWVAAIVLTYRFHAMLVPWISPYFHNSWMAENVSATVMFVVMLLLLSGIASRVGGLIKGSILGGVDHILGAFFGFLRGYVLVIVFYLIAGSFFGSWTSYLMQGSLTAPYIEAGAAELIGYLPHSVQEHLASPLRNGHEASL